MSANHNNPLAGVGRGKADHADAFRHRAPRIPFSRIRRCAPMSSPTDTTTPRPTSRQGASGARLTRKRFIIAGLVSHYPRRPAVRSDELVNPHTTAETDRTGWSLR